MKPRAGESTQRTIENSPAIYRCEPRKIRYWKSAKRTTEALDANRLSPVSRALCLYGRSFPSTEVLGYFRLSAARTGRRGLLTLTVLTALILTSSCQKQIARTRPPLKPPEQDTEVRALAPNSLPNLKLAIDGAVDQVGKTTSYDPSYQKLDYPNGDVPIETGVCSDVIVRAFRKAGIDLQKDVHEDMQANFSAYPTKWGLKSPDSNIDHRRVPNLDTFFSRKGKSLPTDSGSDNFLPGDIVSWDLGGGYTHIGMVTNIWYKPTQRYLVVHNIGCCGTHIDDSLFAWKITGHYRYF